MFLTPEEKIVYLRRQYNITQEELSSSEIKRQFIGMIEIKKRRLSEKTAKIICKNFNKIFAERKINEYITIKELLETREEQALKKLKMILKEEIQKNDFQIEIYFNELTGENKKKYSFLLGEFYLKIKEILIARRYLEISLYLSNPLENIEIILNLTRINYYLNKFEDNIKLVNIHTEYLLKNFNLINSKILYNYAYSLYMIKNIELSISIFEKMLKKELNEDIFFKVNNMLAIINYSELNKPRKALNIYKNLFEKVNDENKLVIYGNYLEIWLSSKKYIRIENVIMDLLNLLECYQTTPDHLFKIYILFAKVYFSLSNFRESYNYYLLALNLKDNKLISYDLRYEILIEIIEKFNLDNYQLDEIIRVFLNLFSQKKDSDWALKFIKKIKNKDMQLILLTKI